MHTVRLASTWGSRLGWVSYDEKLRLQEAKYRESSWAVIDMELWVLYVVTHQRMFSLNGVSDNNRQCHNDVNHHSTSSERYTNSFCARLGLNEGKRKPKNNANMHTNAQNALVNTPKNFAFEHKSFYSLGASHPCRHGQYPKTNIAK